MEPSTTRQARPAPLDVPVAADWGSAQLSPDAERPVAAGAIVPRRPGTVPPLSAEQRQVWLHAALAADLPVYNEQITIRRRGSFDLDAIERSLNAIVHRHESWRTSFEVVNGEVLQRVHPDLHIEVPLFDLSHLSEPQRDAEAVRITKEEACKLFDLGTGPLVRASVLKRAKDDHLLCVTFHHLIIDATSINRVLLPELVAGYADFANGRRPNPEPLPIQHGDYAIWRARHAASKGILSRTKLWGRKLAGAPATLSLLHDRPRPAVPSFRGAVETVEFSPELTRTLKALGTQEGVTLYMVLLAGFTAMLYRYTGQEDILVGGISSMRRRPGLERLIGYFVNLVALRTRPSAETPFRDYLSQIRETVLSAFVAGDVPFDQVVRELQPKREPSIHPLVQVILSLETAEPDVPQGWELTYLDGNSGTAKFDLSISLHERDDRVVGRLIYSSDLFDAATMQRMIGHWTNLLASAVDAPDCPLGRLNLLGDAESRQLLVAWTDTKQECPRGTLYQLFEAQAARTPEAVAVVFEDRAWCYRELAEAAGRMAARLRDAGVRKGILTAICVERSFDMIAGLLGILKAGGAYLPLDPSFPPARLALMLDDANPAVVLTQRELIETLPKTTARIVLCDERVRAAGNVAPGVYDNVGGEDLAYVLYTSGSTGRPNGVAVPHRAVVNLLSSMQREPGFSAQDALLAVTTLSFDIAALEVFLPLISGGRVILADRDTASDPWQLAALIQQSGCTVMQATPATWRGLIEAGWSGHAGLTLLCGGEALPRELAQQLLDGGARLWNVYGPTETTIWSTQHLVTAGSGPVPIGRPIGNTRTYILDGLRNPVPVGIPGDLYIGGTGVAHGYLHRPELTAERFIADPFSNDPDARLYRTGDVARYLPDGVIEYLGRSDRQVKLRGFRIEPGEIETVLASHPSVRQSVVTVRADTLGDERLVGYVAAIPGAARPSAGELRQHLATRLPNYMLPNTFVWLDALPLTPNGKIDRNGLPAPDLQTTHGKFVAPSGEYEENLAAIWREVLGVPQVGATDDFFDLGGHSLLVIPLCARIEAVFGRRLSITAVFHGPTVRQIAALLSDDNAAALLPQAIDVQRDGTHPPLFWVDPGPVFRPLVKALGPDQRFSGLLFSTVLTHTEDRPSRIADIAPHLVQAIRASQPNGPYYLGGWCADGLLAYEVASRLIAEGSEVGLLVLLDTGNPIFLRKIGTFALNFNKLKYHVKQLRRRHGPERWRYALERVRGVLERGAGLLRIDSATRPSPSTVYGIIDRTAMNYEPKPFSGDVVLFQPKERPGSDYRVGWADVVRGELYAYDVPGDHRTMLYEPNVQELGAKLRACLERAQRREGAQPNAGGT